MRHHEWAGETIVTSLPRGAGPCVVAGFVVYTLYISLPNGLRVRVGVDEWERLGLYQGERVAVALPGEPAAGTAYYIHAATWVETWYWVELVRVPATPAPQSAAHAGRAE
jgi:hypothetical protein